MRTITPLVLFVVLALAPACDGDPGFVDTDTFEPQLVTAGSGYAATWRHELFDGTGKAQIRFALLDADGATTAGPTVVSAAPGRAHLPDLASNGDGFAVIWQQQSEPGRGIHMAWLASDGSLTDGPHQIAEVEIQGADPRVRGSVMWTGDEWLATWARPGTDGGYALEAARVAADGSPIEEGLLLTAVEEGGPATRVRWSEGEAAVVLHQDWWGGDGSEEATLARFTATGDRLDDVPLGAHSLWSGDLAGQGGAWVLASEGADDAGMSEVFATVVTPAGDVVGPLQVSDTTAIGKADVANFAAEVAYGSWRPRVVPIGGDQFVVLWSGIASGASATLIAVVDATGAVVSEAQVVLGEDVGQVEAPGAAWTGDTLAIAWHGAGGSFSFAEGPLDGLTKRF